MDNSATADDNTPLSYSAAGVWPTIGHVFVIHTVNSCRRLATAVSKVLLVGGAKARPLLTTGIPYFKYNAYIVNLQ